MEEVKVYMIANLQIHDADRYREYEKGFFPLLKKHSGEFITYDDNITHVEGENPMEGRVILFSFPSEQHAIDWYSDPEYQKFFIPSICIHIWICICMGWTFLY